jgi:hypothetical protein
VTTGVHSRLPPDCHPEQVLPTTPANYRPSPFRHPKRRSMAGIQVGPDAVAGNGQRDSSGRESKNASFGRLLTFTFDGPLHILQQFLPNILDGSADTLLCKIEGIIEPQRLQRVTVLDG